MSFLKSMVALAALLTTVALLGLPSRANVQSSSKVGGYMPIEISIIEGSVAAGNTVRFQVRLNGVAAQNQVVMVTCSSQSAYSSIPSTMTVPQGSDIGTFQATISQNPPMGWTTYASCNGGTASINAVIIE